MYAFLYAVIRDPEYYLRVLVATTACLVPVVAYKFAQLRYRPTLLTVAREADLRWQEEQRRATDSDAFKDLADSEDSSEYERIQGKGRTATTPRAK